MYCTLDDIKGLLPEARLIELTDDLSPNPNGTINTAIVDAAIKSATTDIDGYVGHRYALPLKVTPDLLQQIAVDLAIYGLYRRRNELDISDGMQMTYKNAMAKLKGISDGSVSIGLDPADAGKDFGLDTVFEEQRPLFSMEAFAGW